MALVSLPSDSARLRFQVLRRDCGLSDESAGNEIWSEYDTLKNKFAMEGDPIHWLACGTYVHVLEHSLHADIIHLLKASKMNVPVFFFKLKRMLDIVGKTSKYKNHVAALEDEFNVAKVIFDKLDQLFVDILEPAGNDDDDAAASSSNNKSATPKGIRLLNRKAAVSSSALLESDDDDCPMTLPDLFHFIWVMFIWLKQHERCGALKDDLLNCFHLLVCCFDCVITELSQHGKLNQFLKHGLLLDEVLLRNIESGVGIISWLCTRHVAISDEAMLIQSQWLMTLLDEEIAAGRLKADVDEIDINGTGKRRILRNFLFPPSRFQHNLNYFSESYAGTTSDSNAFDERALLLSSSSKNVVINGEMEPMWIAYNMLQRHEALHSPVGFPADSFRTPPASPPLENMISVTPSSRRASMFEKTPLTAKGQLPGRNSNREKNEMSGTYTNVTSVLLRVRELVALLQHRTNRASPALLNIFRQHEMLDVELELTKHLRDLGVQFLAAFEIEHQPQHGAYQRLGAICDAAAIKREIDVTDGSNNNTSTTVSSKTAAVVKAFARRRLALTQILFWKLVEALVTHELRRLAAAKSKNGSAVMDSVPNVVLQYLRQDQFARNLIALCLEIVLFCHQSTKKFPWTLTVFNISAFDFGLFTEFIIRAEPSLPRDVLRHLHRIEEQVYEELIWRDDSKFWPLVEKVIQDTGRVPSFEDVAGRNQIDDGTGPFSPYRQARIQAIKRYMREHSSSKLTGKMPFNSAARLKVNGISKPEKRPLNDDESLDAAEKINAESLAFDFDTVSSIPYDKFAIVNGSVIMMQNKDDMILTNNNGPIAPNDTKHDGVAGQHVDAGSHQLINNSVSPITELNLVLRKVYSIMAVRLRDLCDRLDIISTDVKQYAQLWSALDLIFRSMLPVLKNRHLDQLILCTIYVLGRLRLIQDKTFQDILTAYRAQPQASSVVYRQVYIGDQEFFNSDGTKTILEERADIINFYNAVFLKQIQPHVAALREQVTLMASPLPKIATRASSFSAKLGPNIYCSIIPANNTGSMADVNGFSSQTTNNNINSCGSNNNAPSGGSLPWYAKGSSSSKSRNNPLVQSPHRIVVRSRDRHALGIGLKPEIRQLNRALDLASISLRFARGADAVRRVPTIVRRLPTIAALCNADSADMTPTNTPAGSPNKMRLPPRPTTTTTTGVNILRTVGSAPAAEKDRNSNNFAGRTVFLSTTARGALPTSSRAMLTSANTAAAFSATANNNARRFAADYTTIAGILPPPRKMLAATVSSTAVEPVLTVSRPTTATSNESREQLSSEAASSATTSTSSLALENRMALGGGDDEEADDDGEINDDDDDDEENKLNKAKRTKLQSTTASSGGIFVKKRTFVSKTPSLHAPTILPGPMNTDRTLQEPTDAGYESAANGNSDAAIFKNTTRIALKAPTTKQFSTANDKPLSDVRTTSSPTAATDDNHNKSNL